MITTAIRLDQVTRDFNWGVTLILLVLSASRLVSLLFAISHAFFVAIGGFVFVLLASSGAIVHDPEAMSIITISALPLIQQSWGLSAPADCCITVMTSWPGFIFRSALWSWRILLALTLPFWALRARRTWPYSAAWTQRYGRRGSTKGSPPSPSIGLQGSAPSGATRSISCVITNPSHPRRCTANCRA